MATLTAHTPVLISLAIAAGITSLELVGWFILCPRFTRLLPFQRPVPEGLPTPQGRQLEQEQRGSGERVAWRWHPGSRALLFRRRLEPGRKPYCIGRLSLDRGGRWALKWAPFPFFTWPAAVGVWIAAFLGRGWLDIPGGSLVALAATALFALVIAANLWLSRRAFDHIVWPELQEQVRDWLG